jgi:hypothetical protein
LTASGTPCAGILNPDGSKQMGCFTDNRATLHLHGGTTPWISDGTPHQWITPAGEVAYPDGSGRVNKGVSVRYVPDMWFDSTTGATITSCAGQTACAVSGATNNPGPGAQTFYYTNQQSARLLFYHDHAWRWILRTPGIGVNGAGARVCTLQDYAAKPSPADWLRSHLDT